MKQKLIIVLISTILLSLFIVCPIHSKNDRKIALGCEMYRIESFSGDFFPTIDVRYWIKEQMGIQANFLYASISAESGWDSPLNATERQIFFGAEFLYIASKGETVNLNLNFGLGFNFHRNIGNFDDRNRTDTILQIGFSPEAFIFDNFSLEVSAGLSAIFYGETEVEGTGADDDYSVTTIIGTPVLSMLGFGFHYYF